MALCWEGRKLEQQTDLCKAGIAGRGGYKRVRKPCSRCLASTETIRKPLKGARQGVTLLVLQFWWSCGLESNKYGSLVVW